MYAIIAIAVFSLSFITFSVSSHTKNDKPKKENTVQRSQIVDETPHTLVGGYYNVRGNLQSKLLLNNKAGYAIEIKPTLYGSQGTIMEIPPVMVESNSHRFIDLQEWANLGGVAFQEGNIKLFHRGKDLVIGSQMHIVDEENSLGFENKFSELGKFDSRRLEAVWWIPSNNTDSNVVLTNTSDEFLTVTATLTRKPFNNSQPKTVNLLPHQTKVLNVRRDFNNGNVFAKSEVLGLSLTHAGREDALLAWTMVNDETKGYSNVATFSNPAKAQSNEYHGAGL